jgi:hypothetical protein
VVIVAVGSVPTLVILGCEAVCKVPVRLVLLTFVEVRVVVFNVVMLPVVEFRVVIVAVSAVISL